MKEIGRRLQSINVDLGFWDVTTPAKDTVEDTIVKWVADEARLSVLELQAQIADLIYQCESPIEQMLAIALIKSGARIRTHSDISEEIAEAFSEPPSDPFCYWVDAKVIKRDVFSREEPYFSLFPQFKVGTRRADFLLELISSGDLAGEKLIVECDGYQHHDSTAEYRIKDKLKERELMMEGYQVLRFTGSEIFKDAAKCAIGAMDCLREMEKISAQSRSEQ